MLNYDAEDGFCCDGDCNTCNEEQRHYCQLIDEEELGDHLTLF